MKKKIILVLIISTILYSCGPRRYKCGPYRKCENTKQSKSIHNFNQTESNTINYVV